MVITKKNQGGGLRGDNRASLVIDIEGESDKTVAFIGHIDTVPVSNPSTWKYDPFSAHIEGDLMYGRGTSDMKSGAACMMYAGLYFVKTILNLIKM